MSNTRKAYEELDILRAQRDLMHALIRVRTAQLKKLTNAGVGYFSERTRWLRERIATVEKREYEISLEIWREENHGN